MHHPILTITIFLIPLGLLSACGTHTVQPWQKQDIARSEMQFDSGPTHKAFDNQFYFSKEGSSGGEGFAGSGCGCN